MSSSSLSIGQILGHYRILEQIGAGGMGVVYRAHDEQLDRDVALKVLPAGTLADNIARSRFRKEGLALAKLDHPNLATVHEFGSQNGVDFLVTAYIPGITLDAKLASGALPQAEVIALGIQLADGLSAAHQQGVIHRDLKPGNLRLTPDNRLKILDFGLARLVEPEAEVTRTESLTRSQEVSGTVPYMAPEQLRGERTDARTDIWATGAVLYEMATGRRPFEGKILTALVADIIHKLPPAPRSLKADLSTELEHLIEKCLQKEPENRYKSAKQLAVELRQLQNPNAAVTIAPRAVTPAKTAAHRSRGPLVFKVMLLVIIGALLTGTAWWFYFSPPVESNLPPLRVVPLTSLPDQASGPAFSPDGNQVAFERHSDVPEVSGLYVKLIGSEHLLQLTKNPADCCPIWSPDGRYIAFSRLSKEEHAIYMLPVIGGLERKLCSRAPARGELEYSPDGRFIAFSDKNPDADSYSIFLLSVETLQIRKLSEQLTAENGDWGPAFSPDGKRLAFVRTKVGGELGDLFVMPASGGKAQRLTFDHASIPSPPAWTTDARSIVFSSARRGQPTLWRISVSGGSPIAVPEVGVVTLHPSISRKAPRLAYEQIMGGSSIWRMEFTNAKKGGSRIQLTASKGMNWGPQFSPDGRRIVFQSDRETGAPAIWMCNSDGSSLVRVTPFDGPPASTPRLSPDNQTIVFESALGEHSQISVIKAEGGLPHPVTESSFDSLAPSWSRDGRWIYFASNRSGSWQVWKVPSQGGQPLQVTKQGGFAAFESADGKFVYYAKTRSDPEIWRVPVEGGPETLVSPLLRPAYWAFWALTDRGIFFITGQPTPHPVLKFFDFATRSAKNVAQFEKASYSFSVSGDGKSAVYHQVDQEESNVMLLENFR